MKVLHLEDDISKHWKISHVLSEVGVKEIDWVMTLSEGLDLIDDSIKSGNLYDLIITDMNFPESKMNKRGEDLSGELLIRIMNERGIQIPIILCSSINYKYPDIYGTVYYSERAMWEKELKELVRGLQ